MIDLREYAHESLSKSIGYDLARNLEESIFQHAIGESKNSLTYPTWDHIIVQDCYRDKLKMLLENLTNPHVLLKSKLERNEVDVSDVCNMTHEDLRPDAWLFQLATPDSQKDVIQESNDSQLKCNSCQRRGFPCYNTEYREFQTRAGDESTTIYAFCRTCLKRWKFS